MMNQKGQAFDVFKLLIAAVVAMAILALLVPIIGTITGLFTKNPTTETRSMITDLYNKPGTYNETPAVTFSTSAPNIAKASITKDTGLDESQICFGLGDFTDEESLWSLGVKQLRYKGTASRLVKIGVVCERGITELQDYIDNDEDDGTNIDSTTCDECRDEDTCCAVMLRRSQA